jgi:hypothetical protein
MASLGKNKQFRERASTNYGKPKSASHDTLQDRVLGVNLDPDNEDALRWKSSTLRLQLKVEEAEKVITAALERLPWSVSLLNERAWVLLIGFFEGIESERGIAWRVADSLCLRQFLQIGLDERTPDHVTLSRTPGAQQDSSSLDPLGSNC